MYCGNCGKMLSPSDCFCKACGAKVPWMRAPGEAATPGETAAPDAASAVATVAEQRPSGEKRKRKDKKAKTVNRWIMVPVSLLIGTAILVFLIIFLELDANSLETYSQMAARDYAKISSIDSGTAVLLGKITIYSVVFLAVLTIYILPLRLTKVIRRSVGFIDRIWITLASLAIFLLNGGVIYAIYADYPKEILHIYQEALATLRGFERLRMLIPPILAVVVVIVALIILFYSWMMIVTLFQTNIEVNGLFWGIVSSVYDIVASILIVFVAFCTAIYAIAIIFAVAMVAGASDGRRVVYIDGEYYYVD